MMLNEHCSFEILKLATHTPLNTNKSRFAFLVRLSVKMNFIICKNRDLLRHTQYCNLSLRILRDSS